MSDLKAGFQDFINRAREKVDPIVEDVKQKAAPVVEDIREKAAPAIDDVKEMAADLKADAAPIVGKVKEAAEKIGSIFDEKAPGLNINNELFDELGQKAVAQKDAAKAKAEEMHRRLQEMMGTNKDE